MGGAAADERIGKQPAVLNPECPLEQHLPPRDGDAGNMDSVDEHQQVGSGEDALGDDQVAPVQQAESCEDVVAPAQHAEAAGAEYRVDVVMEVEPQEKIQADDQAPAVGQPGVQQADLSSIRDFPLTPPVLSVQQYALQGLPPHYPFVPPNSSPAADADTEDLVAAGEPWCHASHGPVRSSMDSGERENLAMDALSDASISDDGCGQDGSHDSPAIGHDTPHACETELADQVSQASLCSGCVLFICLSFDCPYPFQGHELLKHSVC